MYRSPLWQSCRGCLECCQKYNSRQRPATFLEDDYYSARSSFYQNRSSRRDYSGYDRSGGYYWRQTHGSGLYPDPDKQSDLCRPSGKLAPILFMTGWKELYL